MGFVYPPPISAFAEASAFDLGKLGAGGFVAAGAMASSTVSRSAASGGIRPRDVGHLARRDLGGDLDQHRHLEPVEHLGRVLWLHALIHRDDALEAARCRLRFSGSARGRDPRLRRPSFPRPWLRCASPPPSTGSRECRFRARALPAPAAAPAAARGWRARTAIPRWFSSGWITTPRAWSPARRGGLRRLLLLLSPSACRPSR